MSAKRKPMTKQCYKEALSNPGPFVRSHLTENDTPLTLVSEHTGIPYSTLRNFVKKRRPGMSVESIAPLLRFVLWQRGEASDMGRQEQ